MPPATVATAIPPGLTLEAAQAAAIYPAAAIEQDQEQTAPLRARAARKERDAKPGGRIRIPARSLLVLQRRY